MKNFRSNPLTILAVILLITTTSCDQAATTATATITSTETPAPLIQPGDTERTLTINDQERTYLLHIPPGLDRNHLVPVVLVFHGYNTTASIFAPESNFDQLADKSKFIVAYPNGLGTSWNAGGCCGYAVEKNADDIAFVRQILSDLGTIASIDSKRVFAAGFSNGALLSYRIACEMSDTFAAIAPVSGVLFYSPCQPKQPVSVIHVHGLADSIVPYSGGQGAVLANVIFPPVEQGIATWVKLDGCTGPAQVEKQSDVLTHTAYTSCNAGVAVELYTIRMGGHSWPSKYVWATGSQTIWDFFAAHPKP